MSSERDKMLDMITEMNNWNYKKDKIIEDLQSQLDQQKAMWQKLKEWLKEEHDYYLDENYQDCAFIVKEVLDKIQELEGEDE